MKIALLGYGKMGQMIQKVALERGHDIGLVITELNPEDFTAEKFQNIDVAIEFSIPEAAADNIKKATSLKCPVICGTTGWLSHLEEVKKHVISNETGFIYASNYSLGVNIFFALNEKLAQMIAPHQQYQSKLQEIHHTAKLDAPSGTAITLAEGVIKYSHLYDNWALSTVERSQTSLSIEVLRIDPCPGTHSVTYSSEIDDIEIKHTAHTRYGFALGAVIAAEWIVGKKGIFTMKDVLGLS
jgi:4-hydroxy-tetrahydrodipicolinate reductase